LARPAETISRTMPASGPADAMFAANLSETVTRAVVAGLPRGRVLGPHHAVITGNGDLVQDLSYYFGTTRPREHPLFLHPYPPKPRVVPGRLGVLATRGDVNYYHFLLDVLPRLAIMAAAPDIDAPEQWYVPRSTSFQRELLDLVGIPGAHCIDSAVDPHVRADTLVVPSPPSMVVVNPPWVVAWLRSALMRSPIARVEGRRVYVTRGTAGNNRAVTNEPAVMAALAERGFVFVDPGAMSVAEQISSFAEASVIVASHGAALANLVFASPGATVVELFPAGNAVPDYWKLAGGVPGLEYRYLLGVGVDKGSDRSRMLVSDIEVDIPALNRMLDELG
jgi:capsular polysaccharide biosynthesis protein